MIVEHTLYIESLAYKPYKIHLCLYHLSWQAQKLKLKLK